MEKDMSMPRHIAFIMDGNGRWAKQHGKPRLMGHVAGGQTFRDVCALCLDRDIEYVTFFAFSTENWKRPKAEVAGLLKLFDRYLEDWFHEERAKHVRISFFGDASAFSEKQQQWMAQAEKTGVDIHNYLNIAVNYGGRADLVQAANKILNNRLQSGDASPVTEAEMAQYLAAAGMPDVDLLVRTGGELRLSNFLLWQSAYAELYFTKVLWPDFTEAELDKAIACYQKRNRRFGAV